MKKFSRPGVFRSAVLAGLLSTLLAACGGTKEADLLRSARELLARNDTAAARLQVKNVLQKNPQSGQARLLLGQLMLDSGDLAGAEAELDRALELGQSETAVLPLLARALVGQQKGQALLQRHGHTQLPVPLADAQFKTQLAIAHATNNDLDAAQALLDRALQQAADDPSARLLQARLSAARDDNAGALAQLDALLARKPGHAEAWMIRAELLLRNTPQDRAAAEAAYRQALEVKPDLLAAHHGLVMLQLAKPDVAAANHQLALMRKAAPRHPQTLYLDALLAEQRGDYPRAREISQLLLRAAPNNLTVLVLAGQTEFKLNALGQAEALLAKAVQLAPSAATPRRQLAQVQLRAGQPDKALATLRPLVDADPPDAQAVTLSAQAQLMGGDTAGADASFARAAKLQPDDQRLRTSMALSQLTKGQEGPALAELQSIAASDQGSSADLALISAMLRRSDLAGALKAVDGLAAKMPDQPLPDHLRGRIALQRRDIAGARQGFEQALAKNADYLPALAGLAALDLAAKQPAAARARFEAALERKPKNAGAMLALAEINTRSGGRPAESARWLEQAVQADPNDPAARLLLIDHHLNRQQTRPALGAAQSALVALPDNAELLDRLGRAQLLSGDSQQAVNTFTKLAALNPKSPLPQLRLADAQTAASKPVAAAAAVRRAHEIAPQSLAVQQAMASLAMTENQPAQALAIARSLQAAQPDDALGYRLEGEIEQRQQHWDKAAAAYRKALTRQQPGDSIERLHAILLATKQSAQADQLAADWRKDRPDDLAFLLYLGDIALAGKQLAEAGQRYQQVLDRQPDNVLALNNLAYTMALQKQPGALALAQRAQLIAPDTPALMDTLAFCLAAENQLPKAVEVQTQVVAAAPQSAPFRLQLAKLLLQTGNKRAARTELGALARLGPAFAQQAEVTDLLKSVGG